MLINDKILDSLCWDWDTEEGTQFDVPTYTADFETTTLEDDCRVWAWAVCEVGNPDNILFGNDIQSFLKWCEVNAGSRVYFHNLKFDGKFILSEIMSNGWQWIPVKTEANTNTFTSLISDMSQWYSLKLWFTPTKAVEFLDSLKIIPLPIAAIPKAFGLDIEKLDMDYIEFRERGHILTEDEKSYIAHDVKIAALALDIMFDQGMKRMTAGSNAFQGYQKIIGGKKRFRDWFPEPDYDKDLRDGGCYKGGFVGANPHFQGIETGEGVSYDVNSLYPSVMACTHGELLPYGTPIHYEGAYEYDESYPLYIQFLEVDFKIKPDHIPCIQLKGNPRFGQTEYITDSKGPQPMCLTSVDIEMLYAQYDVYNIRYLRGYKFKASQELYIDYVNYWYDIKQQADKDKNEGMRTIAKLMLNSLYGKMATNPKKQSRKPVMVDGIVKYEILPEEYKEPIYLPAGAFITSWARKLCVEVAQKNYNRWIYSDTDSWKFVGLEPPIGIEDNPHKLGAAKREEEFKRFKVLRAKTYCYEVDGKLKIHCAGMPARCHEHVTMENFEFGSSFAGKLKPKDVSGGIILVDDVYTLRA